MGSIYHDGNYYGGGSGSGGSLNQEDKDKLDQLLTKVETLNTEIETINNQIKTLVSSATDITEIGKYALDANQNNATVEGTLANLINTNSSNIDLLSIRNSVPSKRSNLDKIGWYRIAKLVSNFENVNNEMHGSGSMGCDIVLRRGYWHTPNEYHHLDLAYVYKLAKFTRISKLVREASINKIRLTSSDAGNDTYIEIYYKTTALDTFYCSIVHGSNTNVYWKVLDEAIFVEESDSNRSIYGEFDLIAN